ncbi:MAG: TRAP transporter small permease [Lachnospiraceae bacterium]|nr:TRAP transporter small permease [Lachnospiraceae bacterium]
MPGVFLALRKIRPVYDVLSWILLLICKLFLIADVILTSLAVLTRYVSFIRFGSWTEEMVLTCMAYMAVLSAALAIRKKGHIRMTAFDRYLPENVLKALDLIADVAVMVLGVVMLIYGWQFATTLGSMGTYVSIPSLSKFWQYFPIPLAGFFMIVFELECIVEDLEAFWKEGYGEEAKEV